MLETLKRWWRGPKNEEKEKFDALAGTINLEIARDIQTAASEKGIKLLSSEWVWIIDKDWKGGQKGQEAWLLKKVKYLKAGDIFFRAYSLVEMEEMLPSDIKRPRADGMEYVDLGKGGTCNQCNKRKCTCEERRDGTWENSLPVQLKNKHWAFYVPGEKEDYDSHRGMKKEADAYGLLLTICIQKGLIKEETLYCCSTPPAVSLVHVSSCKHYKNE